MGWQHAGEFEIDVDLSPLLGTEPSSALVSDVWYLMAQRRRGRSDKVQAKMEHMLRGAILRAQWSATGRRMLDRRRATRVPLLSRVHTDGPLHLVTTDISLSGLRCSGRPTAPVMNIEFKVPGLAFPVDTRAEVISFKDANVAPLVGLRFINLERPYAEHIAHYVSHRNQQRLAA